MRYSSITAVVVTAVSLAACAQTAPQMASAPTVSYGYGVNDDPEDITSTASAYCSETYGQGAVLLARDAQGERLMATYACE